MKKASMIIAVIMLWVVSLAVVYSGEKAPPKVVNLAYSKLVKLATDPIIVKAVKAENAKAKTLAQIKDMDRKWKAISGTTSYMKALMDSPCGKHLMSVQKSAPYYAEIFVMDNHGAIVAMTDRTYDYWQGNEPKFTESYKGGAGAVHISDVKFGETSRDYLVQVSLPIIDGDKVIGAITIGIDVGKIE